MFPVHLRDLQVPRNQPEDRSGPRFSYNGEWKDTQGNHSYTFIHLPIQHTPQTRGLERYLSSISAAPTPQRPVPVEN
ncbi:hypothetical protein O181_084583 [Austropuccinia psidii MF-1]|uniref:Uncharacterized protein n=1 Tax=Austropuccinia psidii MF-1 TaxID=1389203 RepID=A0A9Q3IKS7_9BASI|nr:hypothetical protein [Austropuccinia psidii MF-1]